MNQKQIFTEYWKILDDADDYVNGRFRRERPEPPEFKIKLNQPVPLNLRDCRSCSLGDYNSIRVPAPEDGPCDLLIISRAVPAVLAEKGRIFTSEEEVTVEKWLEAIDLKLIENCRVVPLLFCPVKDPLNLSKESVKTCFTHIGRIIAKTEPSAVLILGGEVGTALEGLVESLPLFVSPHPSDVLVNPSLKRPVWEVLKRIKDVLVG